jgi:hypothetical protein
MRGYHAWLSMYLLSLLKLLECNQISIASFTTLSLQNVLMYCGCFLDTTDLDALTWVPAAATLSEWFRDGSSAITYWSLASWQAALIMHINNLQWSPITSFPHDRDREMQSLWNTGLLLQIDAAGHPKGLFACSCRESIKSYTRRCFMSRHQMILCHVWWSRPVFMEIIFQSNDGVSPTVSAILQLKKFKIWN